MYQSYEKMTERSRPTFLGIGVTKAGTTWLWSQLNKHPDVWMTPAKEVHYFDRALSYPTLHHLATASFRDRVKGSESWERKEVMMSLARLLYSLVRGRFRTALWWSKWTFGYYDDAWYRSLFDPAGNEQVCGEITPGYAILEASDIHKIKAMNPDIRLILMIRDPVDRAWSGLRHNVAKGGSINWEIEKDVVSRLRKPDVALRGDYNRIVDNYLQVFDSEQLLVCFYDAISRDPEGLMAAITTFLDIREFPGSNRDLQKRVNVSPARPMPEHVKAILTEQYLPLMERSSQRFGSYATSWTSRYSNDGGSGADVTEGSMVPALHP